MITLEQLKKLKPGDPLVVQGEFFREADYGNIFVRLRAKMWKSPTLEILSFSPYCVSLPPEIVNSQSSTVNSQSKYDPTRLFKKGDKVRIVECKGRNTGYDKKIYKVCEDEEESGRYIKLSMDGYIGHFTVDAAYIELVIPVEEIEQYNVVDAHTHWDVADKDMKTIASYSKLHHPSAKAAAEAECKRLNAEWQAKTCRSEDGKEESHD